MKGGREQGRERERRERDGERGWGVEGGSERGIKPNDLLHFVCG